MQIWNVLVFVVGFIMLVVPEAIIRRYRSADIREVHRRSGRAVHME